MISMTMPQSYRGEVSIHGKIVRLNPCEHRLVELLLIKGQRISSRVECIEYIWVDPDREPNNAYAIVSKYIGCLRYRGIRITTTFGWGYSLDCNQLPDAPMDTFGNGAQIPGIKPANEEYHPSRYMPSYVSNRTRLATVHDW